MFRKEGENILVHHEVHYFAMRKTIRIANILLLLSGAALLSTGVYLTVNLFYANLLLDLSVLYTVNVLLLVAGSAVVIFSALGCFDYFFRKRITLCAMNYVVTLVFVLQCILATLAFAWRKEIGSVVRKELERFIKEAGHTSDARISAMDNVQKRFQCCGANSWSDWGKKELPLSCCKASVSATDCSTEKPENIYDKGCVETLRWNYKTCFLIAGVVSVLTGVFQFVCFHVVNYLLSRRE